MDRSDEVAARRQELVELANSMLAGEINLIEGVRRICALRFAVQDPENEAFLPIRAIESETDNFPLGAMRASCSPDYLQRADRDMQKYLADAQDDILQACREIVRKFS